MIEAVYGRDRTKNLTCRFRSCETIGGIEEILMLPGIMGGILRADVGLWSIRAVEYGRTSPGIQLTVSRGFL